MPSQIRSAGESAGKRFKRRKRKRGKRGAVSQRRGRDRKVEGKERDKRDRTERPGDRSDKFKRSRKRRPKRRTQRRQGGDRLERGDYGRDRPSDGDNRDRGPQRQDMSDMKARINEIRARREEFSAQRPEQIAERRGMDPSRLKGLPGQATGPQPNPQGQPTNLDQVNAYDAEPIYGAQPQSAPAPPVIGPDGRIAQPMPAPAPAPVPGMDPTQNAADPGFTPYDMPGPTAPPGVPTDAYGKPATGSGPYNPGPMPPQPQPYPAPQVNPRAAGMERYAAQPPQPITQPGGPQKPERY